MSRYNNINSKIDSLLAAAGLSLEKLGEVLGSKGSRMSKYTKATRAISRAEKGDAAVQETPSIVINVPVTTITQARGASITGSFNNGSQSPLDGTVARILDDKSLSAKAKEELLKAYFSSKK